MSTDDTAEQPLDVTINGQKYILPFERDTLYAEGYKQGQIDMHEIDAAAQARTKQATIDLVRSGTKERIDTAPGKHQRIVTGQQRENRGYNFALKDVNRLLTDIEKGGIV